MFNVKRHVQFVNVIQSQYLHVITNNFPQLALRFQKKCHSPISIAISTKYIYCACRSIISVLWSCGSLVFKYVNHNRNVHFNIRYVVPLYPVPSVRFLIRGLFNLIVFEKWMRNSDNGKKNRTSCDQFWTFPIINYGPPAVYLYSPKQNKLLRSGYFSNFV